MESQASLRYRLPCSVIVVDGRITTRKDPATLNEHHSAIADVSLRVEADRDPDAAGELLLDRKLSKSRDLDITFTPDGRLGSLSATTTGTGGAVVSGLLRLGTFAVSLAATVLARGEPDLEEVYAAKNAEIAKVRREMSEALADLQLRLASLAKSAADAATPDDERLSAQRELRALSTVIAAIRAEAEELDTHFRAWVASRSGTREETWSTTLGTTTLPEREHAEPRVTFPTGELRGALREVADRLGIVPVRIADDDEQRLTSQRVDVAAADHAVVLRLPRAYTLAVYALSVPEEDAAPDAPRTGMLQSIRDLWVLDARCALAALPLDSGLFSKQSARVEFAETGALTRVTSATTTAAQGVSDAVAAAGETAIKSAEEAKALLDSLGALRDRRADERLTDLQRDKAILEAEVAAKGLLAGRADRQRLAALEAQLDAVKASRALGAEAAGAELDARATELRHRLELAKLEAELAKLRAGAPDGL